MPTGRQNQSRALRTGGPDRTRHLIGEGLDHQRMARIGVVVVERDCGVLATRLADRLSKRFALEKIEVQRSRKHEDLAGVPAIDCGGQGIDRRPLDIRSKTENGLAGRSYCTRVCAI